MSNEMTVANEVKGELIVQRDPEIVLQEAQRAAQALKNVIATKKNPVTFNGEQYLEYEDWQTIGKFYGLTVKTGDAVYHEIDGVKGAKATAHIIDVKTGLEIGQGDGWCMRDEQNWKNKPWYQLSSMAQTRAGSKAFSNVLRFVPILAGYKGTPAEEIVGVSKSFQQAQVVRSVASPSLDEILENDAIEPIGPTSHAPRQKKEGTISEAQGKRFYAIYKKAGKSDDEVKEYLTSTLGISDSRDMRWQDYKAVCDWAEGK